MKKKLIFTLAGIVTIVAILVLSKAALKNSSNESENQEKQLSLYYGDGNNDIDKAISKIFDAGGYETGMPNVERRGDYAVDKNTMPDSVTYNGITYYKGSYYVEDEYVGEEYGVEEANGLTLYKINQITEKFSVAVKDEASGQYFSYSRWNESEDYYVPADLQEFFEVTGFFESIKNLEVSLCDVRTCKTQIIYYDNSDNFKNYFVNEIKNISAKNSCNKDDAKKSGLLVTGTLDHIEEEVAMCFYENGYIKIECGELIVGMGVDAGEDGIAFGKKFIEYLNENAQGYIDDVPKSWNWGL